MKTYRLLIFQQTAYIFSMEEPGDKCTCRLWRITFEISWEIGWAGGGYKRHPPPLNTLTSPAMLVVSKYKLCKDDIALVS